MIVNCCAVSFENVNGIYIDCIRLKLNLHETRFVTTRFLLLFFIARYVLSIVLFTLHNSVRYIFSLSLSSSLDLLTKYSINVEP